MLCLFADSVRFFLAGTFGVFFLDGTDHSDEIFTLDKDDVSNVGKTDSSNDDSNDRACCQQGHEIHMPYVFE